MSDSTYGDELADVFASFALDKNPTGLSLGIDSAYELGDHIASTWLADHDAKVRAEALRDARDAVNVCRNSPSLITLADKFGGYHQGERAGLERAEDIITRIERGESS